ncbi:lipoprotein-releasing ABC transporter permease subunit [Candidatus Kinetoplastidibacterium desouzai]|nr:lipoprotein-releasing ABC transporter permease subunit [Candidatus Kinetoplastibacterium desouzaii]
MFYEFWLAIKYSGILSFRNRKRDKFLSFITITSVLGIAIGVASLIVVLSVMNGFQKEVRNRMLAVVPHIELSIPGLDYSDFHNEYQKFSDFILHDDNIKSSVPFLNSQAMILKESRLIGVQVQGINSNFIDAYCLDKSLLSGDFHNLKDGCFNTIIGSELSKMMDINVGDTIFLVVPCFSSNLSGFTPRLKKFKIEGIFSSGYYEYDSNVVYISINDASKLFIDNAKNGIRISLYDVSLAPITSSYLKNNLPYYFNIEDWSSTNKFWFDAVQTEKRMMFLILSIIIAVATFNLFSSLVMLVTEKKYEISILRTFGARSINILMIFLLNGLFIGFIGTVVGVLFGVVVSNNVDQIVSFIENIFQINLLPRDAYFIDKLPHDINYTEVLKISVMSICMSLISTIYPTIRALKFSPAQVLNHVR